MRDLILMRYNLKQMTRQFSTVHPLYLSFYSKALYRDVAGNWRGVSFLYLVLLLAVCLIPVSFKVHADVSEYVTREAPKFVKQVPDMTIARGRLSLHEPMPYVITDPETGKPFMIIDTTGTVTSLKGSEAFALLTEKQLIMKSGHGARSLDLSEIEDLVIDQGRVYAWIEMLLASFMFVLYPTALLFSFLFRLGQALLFAALGILLARNLKLTLTYRSLLSLAIVSMTPAIIISSLYDYLGASIPLWWLFSFFLALGYFAFALNSNKEEAGRGAV